MHIIVGSEVAAELRKKHTVLELESFPLNGGITTAYCVVTPESVIADLPDLERLCGLHQAFIDSFNSGQYSTALDAVPHVRGRFAGELDSFYDAICERIKNRVPHDAS